MIIYTDIMCIYMHMHNRSDIIQISKLSPHIIHYFANSCVTYVLHKDIIIVILPTFSVCFISMIMCIILSEYVESNTVCILKANGPLECPCCTWAGINTTASNCTRVTPVEIMEAGKQHALATTVL